MEVLNAAQWDSAAENYQQVFALGISEYNRRVLEFLGSKGHIFSGSRIFDIGCGVGKYGTYLAAMGCRLALNDISPKMLDYAKDNMSAYPETEFFEGDFADKSFPSDTGSFELVMSTMSPAVNSTEALKKMTALSRGGCFAARFYDWQQPTRNRLLQLAGIKAAAPMRNVYEDCLDFEKALAAAGIDYERQLQPYNWSDRRTAEEFADYAVKNCGIENADENLRKALILAAESLADENGLIKDEVNTQTAWYYWKGTAEK